MSLTPGHFLAKTADLLGAAIKRASVVDQDGNVYGANVEAFEQRAALLAAVEGGAAYSQTVVALTAAMIAGTAPILLANPNRKALQFGGAARDFAISLQAGQARGMPIYATARDDLVGKLCPLGAIYLATGSGFAPNDTIVIWEA